ncbi:hypothetical protein BGZ91_008806 [Linnemannia elongata]|nr:hypothetical protein BGZ91_008806 [Linnemannia elongata]
MSAAAGACAPIQMRSKLSKKFLLGAFAVVAVATLAIPVAADFGCPLAQTCNKYSLSINLKGGYCGECISMVGSYLVRSDLYNCVFVSKNWLHIFTPHLWKLVQIHCRRGSWRHTIFERLTQDQLDNWFQKLKRSIEAGGLDRNGQYVQTFDCEHYEAVELVLNLGSYPDPDLLSLKSRKFAYVRSLDLSPLICILNRNSHLRHLRVAGRMLDEKNYDFTQLLEAIPRSIVCLSLRKWDPIKGKRGYDRDLLAKEYESKNDSTSYLEEQEDQGETRFPRLKEVEFCGYAFDLNKRTMEYILKNCPNLEILSLGDIYQPIPLKPTSRILARYCPRTMHLYVLNWSDCLDAELAELLDSGKAGWRTLDLPTTWSMRDEDEFGPLSTAAILKHSPTLENLRVDDSRKFSRAVADELFRTAPNIQRIYVRPGEPVVIEESI